MNFHLHLRFGEFSEQDDIDLNFEGVQKQCNLLKVLCTPSDVRSASDRTQLASDLASDARSQGPFHFKQFRRTRDPGLLWSQSMVPNLCFRKQQPFFAHNFKRNSTALFNSFTTGCLSIQCNFVLLVELILLQNQTNFLFNDPSVRPEMSERC